VVTVMILAGLCGVLAAGGVLLVVDGFRHGAQTQPLATSERPRLDQARIWRALGLGLAGVLLTRWVVAALALAALGWFWTELFGSRRAREAAVARTEAIASWTEMLRDTMAGAHGLEEALLTTALVAPDAIRSEVTALAIRIERQPLDAALRAFADELDHPTADLVVTALTLAAHGSVGDLSELLGTLAVAARDETAMRLRVEAARARLRTAVRVIAAVTGTTVMGLIVMNRSYLDAYSEPAGQLVLAVVATMWGVGLWWLSRMSRFMAPERFFVASPEGVTP
jgi:Flp pilus assembly protein TadB